MIKPNVLTNAEYLLPPQKKQVLIFHLGKGWKIGYWDIFSDAQGFTSVQWHTEDSRPLEKNTIYWDFLPETDGLCPDDQGDLTKPKQPGG